LNDIDLAYIKEDDFIDQACSKIGKIKRDNKTNNIDKLQFLKLFKFIGDLVKLKQKGKSSAN